MTMQLIETKTLGTAATSIAFTSIPQTYTDLFVLASTRTDFAGTTSELNLQVNSSGGSDRVLYSIPTVATGSNSSANIRIVTSANTATASTFGLTCIYLPNYTSTVAKQVSTESISEGNIAGMSTYMSAAALTSTAAVTTLSLVAASSANIVAGSTVSLYGILKGSSGGVVVS